jgi:hypothetical protein
MIWVIGDDMLSYDACTYWIRIATNMYILMNMLVGYQLMMLNYDNLVIIIKWYVCLDVYPSDDIMMWRWETY